MSSPHESPQIPGKVDAPAPAQVLDLRCRVTPAMLPDAPGPGSDDFDPKSHYWDGKTWWSSADKQWWWDGLHWRPFNLFTGEHVQPRNNQRRVLVGFLIAIAVVVVVCGGALGLLKMMIDSGALWPDG
jgi:hypothetical protein